MSIKGLFKEIYFCYEHASREKKIIFYFVAYTLIFLPTFLLTYLPLSGTSFIEWSDKNQFFTWLVYIGRAVRHFFWIFAGSGASFPFDISNGLGENIIGTLNSNGQTDPLVWLLSPLVPTRYSEYLYAFLTAFRIYLAGLSFSFLCFYFDKKSSYTLIGALVYCFNGWVEFYCIWQPYFANALIYMPLLIVGADKILRKRNPLLFSFSLFYATLSGYYLLYCATIILLVYSLVRFFDLYQSNRLTEFFSAVYRGLKAYALGIGLGAVIFFPSVIEFFNCSRFGRSHFLHYEFTDYLWRFLRFVSPPAWHDDLTFVSISFFALVLVFITKNRTLKLLSLIGLVFYFTSIGGMIMNGFQYPNRRWAFGLVLLIAFITTEMLPTLLNLSRKNWLLCFSAFIVYISICIFGELLWKQHLHCVLVGAIFLGITLLFLTDRYGISKVGITNTRKVICLILIFVNAITIAAYRYNPGHGGIFTLPREQVLNELQTAPERELERYLFKNPDGRGDGSEFMVNSSLPWRIPGLLSYNSTSSSTILDFWRQLENPGVWSGFKVYSSDQRTILNTLLSVKYQVEKLKNRDQIPYGYKRIAPGSGNSNEIYENLYALPWGYTYDKVMTYSQLNSLNGIKKQQAMLQAIALDGGLPTQEWRDLKFDDVPIPYKITCQGCEWSQGKLKVFRPNAEMILNFNMPINSEGYLQLKGFNLGNVNYRELALRVFSGNIVKTALVEAPKSIYYEGRENILFNLGYSKKERNTLRISFSREGEFNLVAVNLFSLSMENYERLVEKLREEHLADIKWKTNGLAGKINLSKDKILCLSIPYSKGWTAKVDGKEVNILKGNYLFMAIPLTAGHHYIELEYVSHGIKLGIVITFISWIIAIVLLYRTKLRNSGKLMRIN